jgi:phospholipid transport system substrate-binding protein
MKHFALLLAALLATLLSSACPAAAQEAPDALIRRVSQDVLSTVQSVQTTSAGSRRRILDIAEAKILPYVDLTRATALAVGRSWRDATPDQRRSLTDQFRMSIVFSLTAALSREPYQGVDVAAAHVEPADDNVRIAARVMRLGGAPIPLIFLLERGASGWKISDVSVSGAALVQTYKTRFAAEIGKGGIDGLIRMLATNNQRSRPPTAH